MLPPRMLPFALSRFIAAHFDAPKNEPEVSVRWKKLHGHSMATGLQAYMALGGMEGFQFTPQIDDGNRVRAESRTPFEDALNDAQSAGSQLPLLEPFVGTLGIGKTKAGAPYFALISVRSARAPVVGWRPTGPALDLPCADDVSSFAALNYISAAVLGRGVHPGTRGLKPLIGALDDRVAFPPPYDGLEQRLAVGDLFPVEWTPDPPPHRFYLRSAYLIEMLTKGEFSMDAWADFEQPELDPTRALRNIAKSTPTAMYWMWRLFFEGHDEGLVAVLDAARTSKAAWIIDAARIVGELAKGRKRLGVIDDVQALREYVAKTVKDPAMLAARKAAQRRDTVDKRIGSMRVPSGMKFEPTTKVPPADEQTETSPLAITEGGLSHQTDDGPRLVLPPEPGTRFVDAVALEDGLFAVLSEKPGEKATRRRLTLYKHGEHRTMRLGGQVFQDLMGSSGLVGVTSGTVALWKEAVEEERMFPWTGRTTIYAVIKGNLVSLGGASYDCVGVRKAGGELYGMRADGSGYRATKIDEAIDNQSKFHSGPRFAPIPVKDAPSEEGWRDVYEPGPVTRDNGMLRWKRGPLPRSGACPEHLASGDLGVATSRDGKVAWLMTRTGSRIDQLDLATGKLELLCEWPAEEGWPVGVAEAGNDLVLVSTWRIRVLKSDTRKLLWSKDAEEARSVAALPSRHFAVLGRGGSGPGILTIYYVRDLPEAPENESDAAGEWSSYGYSGEEMFLVTRPEAIAIAGESTRGFLDPEILDKVPHWARSRGWFGEAADGDDHHHDQNHHDHHDCDHDH